MSIAWRFYVNGLQRLISYRVEFWMGFLGSLASQFVVAFFLWKAIFAARGTGVIQGYTFGGLMLYYLLVPLVERVSRLQEMGGISDEIYGGGLSRFLLYPISFFQVKYAETLAQSTIYLIQLAIVLCLYCVFKGRPEGMGVASLAMGFSAMWASATLCFFLSSTVGMVAFWADNVWSLWVMVRLAGSLLGGGMIPFAFYPGWARIALEWLPFGRLISFPLRCLLGQVGTGEWVAGMALSAAWALVFAGSTALLWKRGLKTYAGVGI